MKFDVLDDGESDARHIQVEVGHDILLCRTSSTDGAAPRTSPRDGTDQLDVCAAAATPRQSAGVTQDEPRKPRPSLPTKNRMCFESSAWHTRMCGLTRVDVKEQAQNLERRQLRKNISQKVGPVRMSSETRLEFGTHKR